MRLYLSPPSFAVILRIGYLYPMRIWDIDPALLCDRRLLGEHNELHALWNIILKGLKGFSNHPETKRWRGKIRDLYLRHEARVKEMERRGFRHVSPLDEALATGKAIQDELKDPIEAQERLLSEKTPIAGRG